MSYRSGHNFTISSQRTLLFERSLRHGQHALPGLVSPNESPGVDKCTARNLGNLIQSRVPDPSPGLGETQSVLEALGIYGDALYPPHTRLVGVNHLQDVATLLLAVFVAQRLKVGISAFSARHSLFIFQKQQMFLPRNTSCKITD